MKKLSALGIVLIGLLLLSGCSGANVFPAQLAGRWCHDEDPEIVLHKSGRVEFHDFPAVYLDPTLQSSKSSTLGKSTVSGPGKWRVASTGNVRTLRLAYIQQDGSRFGGGWTEVQFQTIGNAPEMSFYDDDPDTSNAYGLTRCNP